jgi:hypothetical protein
MAAPKAWIAEQPAPPPSRPEAIRRLIERGMAKCQRPRGRDVDAHNNPRAEPAAVHHQQIGPRHSDEHLAAAGAAVAAIEAVVGAHHP